jgi:hypothetical protein
MTATPIIVSVLKFAGVPPVEPPSSYKRVGSPGKVRATATGAAIEAGKRDS